MFGKKFAAMAMSAVLAASLCPGIATAAPLAAGEVSSSSAQALSTQATKNMWVVSEISYSYSSSRYTYWKDYSYNNKGLVSSTTQSNSSSYSRTYQDLDYSSKGNLKKITTSYSSSSSNPTVYKFKYSGGRLSQVTNFYSNGNNSSKYVYSYGYANSGAVKSQKSAYYSYRNNNESYSSKMKKRSSNTSKFTEFKNGRPTKMVNSSVSSGGYKSISAPVKYAYNGKGNLAKEKSANYSPTIYSYTYENGRVATRMAGTSSTTYKFSWRQVKVPTNLVGKVRAQQWSIMNKNLNYAFGPVNLGY